MVSCGLGRGLARGGNGAVGFVSVAEEVAFTPDICQGVALAPLLNSVGGVVSLCSTVVPAVSALS